jgi:hypothetical protein
MADRLLSKKSRATAKRIPKLNAAIPVQQLARPLTSSSTMDAIRGFSELIEVCEWKSNT